MAILGSPLPRLEDARLLIGASQYVADLELPSVLSVTYVTSTMAHAVICNIDVAAARATPGVVEVVTAADVDLGSVPSINSAYPEAMLRPMLATGRVRFVGEPVVAIVAETTMVGEDAAAQVEIDYEALPPLMNPEAALKNEILLFPDAGTNVVLRQQGGSTPDADSTGEIVVRARFVNQRVAPCPLEGRAAASWWDNDNHLTHWSSCQGPHPVRASLSRTYGLATEAIRVVAPDVGGSFGAKARSYPEELLLPWLARRVGRPVRWVSPRSQDMSGLGHSRAQIQNVEIAGNRDGTVCSVSAHILSDAGAYPLVAPLLAANTGRLMGGAYRIPVLNWTAEAVVTNTTPVVAYRGAGRPEAGALIERAMDLFAAELGLDPVEVRRRNLLRPEDFPYAAPTAITYDSGDYQRALAVALDRVGYDSLRAEQVERRRRGDSQLLGVGLAVFVDRTAGVAGSEYGAVELRPDGTMLVRTGSSPHGQGHHTAWAMIVAERTGLPIASVEVVYGDTDIVPRWGDRWVSVSPKSRGSRRRGSRRPDRSRLRSRRPGAGGGYRGHRLHHVGWRPLPRGGDAHGVGGMVRDRRGSPL